MRNGLRASVESYSIKRLEPLYGFARGTPLAEANRALAELQACLELADFGLIDQNDRSVVAGYNCDDCLSTLRLRDWLEERRATLVEVPRPQIPEGAPSEKLGDRQRKVNALRALLTEGIPADVAERTDEQHARWLLAYLLDFHRREDKALWWEYFRLCDLTADELLDERAALSGLTFVETIGRTARGADRPLQLPAAGNGTPRRRTAAHHRRRQIWNRRGHLARDSVRRHQEAR